MSSAACRMRASGSGKPGLKETSSFCVSLVEGDIGRVETLLELGMAVTVGEEA